MIAKGQIVIMLVICLSVFVAGCRTESGQRINQLSVKSNLTVKQNAKPVIFILIDSLMDKSLRQSIQEGRAPAMEFLLKNGRYFPKVVSSFPTAQQDPQNSRNARAWKKFGMNDEFSAQDTGFLIKQNKLPPLTIAYFPENDHIVHTKGPAELSGIEKADRALQNVLNAYGSWDQALKKAMWIIMGDSGQSPVYKDRAAAIVDLKPLLNQYRNTWMNMVNRGLCQATLTLWIFR